MIDATLLERTAELRALDSAVRSAAARVGAFVAVQGGPGLGKTRLLVEAGQLAEAAGLLVLRARASELEQGFDFGLLRQLFEPVLATAQRRQALLSGTAAPAAVALGLAPPPQAPHGDFAVLRGLFRMITNLCRQRPLALVCDDVHWADHASLQLLAYLLPRLDGLGVLIVTGLRPATPGLAAPLLGQLNTDPACQVLSPAPLSQAASVQLLASELGRDPEPAFALACHTATGGNPMLLRELAAVVRAAGITPSAGNADQVVRLGTQAVARRVDLWLSEFPTDRLELARAFAVLGARTPLFDAAELARLPAPAALAAVDDLENASILRPTEADEPTRFEFVHPLVRSAIYDQLTHSDRAQWHRAAADLLTVAGAGIEKIAAHLRLLPETDSRTVRVLREAATKAIARGAPDTALSYLRRCLEAPTAIPESEYVDLLTQAGSVAMLVDIPGAIQHLDQALALAQQPQQRADIAYRKGRALLVAERTAEARQLYSETLRWLPADDEDLRRRIQSGQVLFELGMSDPAHSDPAVIAELRALAPTATLGGRMLDCTLAQYDCLVGDSSAVPRALRAAADPRLVEQNDIDFALSSMWEVLSAAERPEALPSMNAGLTQARRLGSAPGVVFALGMRGQFWLWRGDLAEAATDLREAMAAIRPSGIPLFRRFLLPWLATVLVEQGQLADAAAVLADVGALHPLPPYGSWFGLLEARALLLRTQGRYEEAAQAAMEAGRHLSMHGFANPAVAAWRSEAALSLLALRRPGEARLLAAEELELARRWGALRPIGRALRVLGRTIEGRPGRALLEQAVDTLQRSQARLEYAKALADLGATLRRDGQQSQARPHLQQALDLAAALGATPLADRVLGDLRALGSRPRRRALTGPNSLTPSERRVAELAALGRTNREIAQQLFVTPKTVEVHLSNAYRKLEINRRDHLARALEGTTDDDQPGSALGGTVPAPGGADGQHTTAPLNATGER